MWGEITTADLSQFWHSLVRKLAPANCLKMLEKWYTNVDQSPIYRKITKNYRKETISNKRLQQDYKVQNPFALCSRLSPHNHPHILTPSLYYKTYHTTILPLYTIPPYQYTIYLLNKYDLYILYILLNQYELNIYPIDLIGYNTNDLII